MGYTGRGEGGGKGVEIENSLGDRFRPKMMILHGVRHLIPQLGHATQMTPQKGGYTTPAPALRDFVFSHCGYCGLGGGSGGGGAPPVVASRSNVTLGGGGVSATLSPSLDRIRDRLVRHNVL